MTTVYKSGILFRNNNIYVTVDTEYYTCVGCCFYANQCELDEFIVSCRKNIFLKAEYVENKTAICQVSNTDTT